MILLDTNVLSELMRERPSEAVVEWFGAVSGVDLYVSSVTEAELLRGVENLDDGKAKVALRAAVSELLQDDFADQIIPFDRPAARQYAMLFSQRKRAGRPISVFDCMIAATAHAHGLRVATRNLKDFDGCGIEIVNPWALDPLHHYPIRPLATFPFSEGEGTAV